MPRSTAKPASRERHRRVLKQAKGYRGARSKRLKSARETVMRAMDFAYRHRRTDRKSVV